MSRSGPSTRLHAREMVECFADPGVRRGPFRVLPRTDYFYVVVDERRPMGDQTVFVAGTRGLIPRALDEATFALELLADRAGIPPEGQP